MGFITFAPLLPPRYWKNKIRQQKNKNCETIKLYVIEICKQCVCIYIFTIRQKYAVRYKIWVPSIIMDSVAHVKDYSWLLIDPGAVRNRSYKKQAYRPTERKSILSILIVLKKFPS